MVAKIYGKKESSIREIVKNERETRASFAIVSQPVKVTVTAQDTCLVKMEKAFNLYNKIFSERERERPHSHNFYYSKWL